MTLNIFLELRNR